MSVSLQASALGTRYRPHIEELRGFINQVAMYHRLLAPLLMLVWHRLYRGINRLDRLALRWQMGKLRRAKPRARAERKPPVPADPEHPSRTPQGHAWLIRLHQPMAQWAPRIQMLVDDPEIIALCAEAPQAGRILRPLCRMFGIALPPHIHRPPAPRKPRPKKPRKPKPPPFAEHSPSQWPYVPPRLRLRVPGLPIPGLPAPGHRRRKPSG